ncbi:MAG: 50S ribosomal protein L5 [Parcubacteria group bacterium]|nr:50S ribosomal protein L5 [Parcubacteria group bacterium]
MTLKELYKKEIIPKMKEHFGFKNNLEVPNIKKVTINVGLGSFLKETKHIDEVVETIKKITGQAPVKTTAKKAVSGFSIRDGQVIGLKVTLRGENMYEFLNKLINVVFPRVRDFRGLSTKSFDGSGNYTIGLKEHTVFPEVGSSDMERVHGLEVCITTNAREDKEVRKLLELYGFPFKKKNN